MTRPSDTPKPDERFGNWVKFLVSLAVLGIGVWLLFLDWHGKPVAAAFTRVGGLTRVETAVHASHLWTTPPRYFVTTTAYADQQTMVWAAQTAMANDAPLLFTSENGKVPRLVRATIDSWRFEAKRSRLGYYPTWINVKKPPLCGKQCQVYKILAAINRRNLIDRRNRILQRSRAAEMHGGVVDRLIGGVPGFFKVAEPRLSTLTASNRLLPWPLPVARRDTLAPVVIFAVARRFPVTSGPAYPPDVAVGLALASHLAINMTTASPKVSLVVVPRGYLEADPPLEQRLRDQRGMVQGGVVLGSTRILTDSTQALLRQILTSIDRQTLLDQVQADLGSVEPVVAALLALIALGAAAQTGRKVIPEAIQAASKVGDTVASKLLKMLEGRPPTPPPPVGEGPHVTASNPEPTTPTRDEWLGPISEFPDRRVTVRLSSGWAVNGTVGGQDKVPASLLRINGANQMAPKSLGIQLKRGSSVEPFVLVPVKDIASIDYGFEDNQLPEMDMEPRMNRLQPH